MEKDRSKQRRQEERRRNARRFFRGVNQRISKGWRALTGFMKNIYLGLLLLAGVGMAVGAVLAANTLVDQSTAVLVAAVGSALGTAVFAFTLPAVLRTKVREGVRLAEADLEEKLALSQELNQLRQVEEDQLEEIITLEKEKAVLQRELEKQKRMHIEVDSIQPVEKVSFLEVKSMITDVLLKELESSPPDGVRKGVEQEYLGVLDTRFKANLGVDMKKVGLRINDSGQIVITGIRSEFQGFFIEDEDWKLYELREKKWGGLLSQGASKKILPGDERLAELTIEQRSSLMDRLSMGVDFSYLDESIRKFTTEYLSVLLAPLNREIIFTEDEQQPTLQLGDFLSVHNARIEEQIARLQAQLAEVERRLLEEGEALEEKAAAACEALPEHDARTIREAGAFAVCLMAQGLPFQLRHYAQHAGGLLQ